MRNRLLTDKHLEILLSPSDWRVVGGGVSGEVDPVDCSEHLAWAKDNTHRHAHREAMIVLSGGGEYGYMGRSYPCSPGTVFLISPFEDHDSSYGPNHPDADHLWMGLVEGECIFRLIVVRNRCVRVHPYHILKLEEDGMRGIGDSLAAPIQNPLPPRLQAIRCRSLFSLLILEIVREGYAPAASDEPQSFQEKIITTILTHIRSTAGNGVSLDVLSRLSGYSKYHFHRMFKRTTGRTVHEYVDLCRMQKVDEMLRSGAPLKEISIALGFSSQSAFSRWLRKR